MKEKNLNKRLTIELPASKHKEIKLAATALGISMKELIDLSLEIYIKNLKEKR
jgi:predicted HicB family RNase H-like nuclease